VVDEIEWARLRDRAWAWDPLGMVDHREHGDDEYDVLIVEALRLQNLGCDEVSIAHALADAVVVGWLGFSEQTSVVAAVAEVLPGALAFARSLAQKI
jgi:hypothetical protein